MPSRRRLLAGSGIGLAAVVGSSRLLEGPVATTAATAFDWPMPRYGPAGTAFNDAASGPRDDVAVRWERDVEAIQGPSPAPPTLAGDTLFAVGRRSVVALERDDGSVRFERDGYSYLSAPTVATAGPYRTETLVVRGNEGLYGLSAGGGYALAEYSAGLERWFGPGEEPSIRTSANPHPPAPVAASGRVYAALPDRDVVVALDATSGRLEWTYEPPAGAYDPHRPAVSDDTVFVTSGTNHVAALDVATGEPRWETRLDPSDPDAVPAYRQLSAPTATGAGLVVPSERAVSLLDSEDGGLEWEYVHDGAATDGSVAVADGTIFAADGVASLHAIALETGDELWTSEYRHDVHPVVADGVVYCTYAWLPDLVAFDADSGERLWTYDVPNGPSQPIVGDGVLYVAGHEGIVALEEGA